MVQIRLLGGITAATDGGDPADVGPAKCQAVLAVLALSAGSAVPVPRLVTLVWGDDPPRTADKTLQSYVARLRKGLGADSIVRTGVAYRLDLDPEAVDVVRFQRRLASGDVEGALAEWSGPPLAGLDAGGHGLAATVDALTEQWLGAVEVDLERRIETDAPTVIGALTELTAGHPFREGLWALLMTALYRVGRQADALAAYRRARGQLVEHLGVEPGPRLRELEALILGHDEKLQVDRAPRGPALGAPTGTVTFGFTDVEDSTRLWATQPEATAAAMARYDTLVRATVERHGGYVFAVGGDSVGAAFHRAVDAAAWATELQSATVGEPWPGAARRRVRIGLHTGETEERSKGYFGPAVIVAARLAAAGHGGQVLVSGVTAALLSGGDSGGRGRGAGRGGEGGGAALRSLGSYRLDGVVAEQRILQLGEGDHPPLRLEDRRRGNLPRRWGRLIGRHTELEVVAEALAEAPVVTLVGPGGIGKTRLALAAAARMSEVDGQGGSGTSGEAWLVELARIATSDDVPRAVADALDIQEEPDSTLVEAVLADLRRRTALVVLDNCEHVVDGAAALARAIAESCPDVRVLATSREGLGLGNGTEQLVVVAPLDPAGPAVELFAERATAASPAFDLAASRADVEEICRRLDGVPLAIELAAARARSLSPAELVERLDDRLRLLTGGRRASVERHRTLRATIQWSYDLLTPAEQVVFQRLSIFAGPFDLVAAETVVAGDDLDAAAVDSRATSATAEVDDLLGALVERSMLIVESGAFGRRFRLLETMRQFGAEHLSERGDRGGPGGTHRVAERHARWCLDQVTQIRALLASPHEIEGVARLAELWPNLRAAVDWACSTGDRHLAHELVRPVAAEVYLRSQSEIGDWAERILDLTPADDTELVLFGVTWAARRYMRRMDRAGYERLVQRYGEPDAPMIRYARAFLYADYARMAAAAPEALAELRRQGEDYVADLFEVAALALSLLLTGQMEELDARLTPRIEHYRVDGPPTCLTWALNILGLSATLQGQPDRAWRFYEESAGVAVPDGTHSLRNPVAARVALRRGHRSRAVRSLRSYLDELLDHENIHLTRLACVEFVNMMAKLDRLPDAARMLAHMEATGGLDASPAYRGLVAEAGRMVRARGLPLELLGGADAEPDDRQALVYMRDVLDLIASASPTADPVSPKLPAGTHPC